MGLFLFGATFARQVDLRHSPHENRPAEAPTGILHGCDDRSRQAYTAIHADETTKSVVEFLCFAVALYKMYGILIWNERRNQWFTLMEKIYKCFVSSTYEDLVEERNKVFEVILDHHNMPVGMEHFNASDDSQWNYITKMLAGCDYFILIVAHRYGSTTDDGMSFTEKETRYAKEEGIPVLAFILSDKVDWPGSRYEKSPENAERLKNFKEWLKQDAIVKEWKDKGELGEKVSVALSEAMRNHPRPGYMRGNIDKPPQQSSNQGQPVRKPRFQVKFSEKEEIRINLDDLVHPPQREMWSHVTRLTPGTTAALEGVVSQKEIDEWNSHVQEINRQIDERNAETRKFNEQYLNIPLPFSFSNVGTMKAHELSVRLVFPEWLTMRQAKYNIPIPDDPHIKPNPITAAINRNNGQVGLKSEDLQRMLDMFTHWDKYIAVNKDFDPAGISVDILSHTVAFFKLDQLQHLSTINCSGIYCCPAAYPCEGTLKISCHCDELPQPELLEIPIIIFRGN